MLAFDQVFAGGGGVGRLAKATICLGLALGCGQDPDAVPPQRFQSRPHAPVFLFTNGGFESGNLSSWAVTTNLNPRINYPPASVPPLNLQPGRNANTFARTGTTEPT